MKKGKKTDLAIGIITRRKALNLSAMKLAEKVGIPYPTLREIEAGNSQGNPKTKEKLCLFFGCSLADLYRPFPIEKPSHEKTLREITVEDMIYELKNKDYPEPIRQLIKIAIELPVSYQKALLKDANHYLSISKR